MVKFVANCIRDYTYTPREASTELERDCERIANHSYRGMKSIDAASSWVEWITRASTCGGTMTRRDVGGI